MKMMTATHTTTLLPSLLVALLLALRVLHASSALTTTAAAAAADQQLSHHDDTLKSSLEQTVLRRLRDNLSNPLDFSRSLLQQGKKDDFDMINELFSQGAYINLPNVELQETGVTLALQNPICQDISVQDITLTLQPADVMSNNNKLVMILQIYGLDMNCISDFTYSLLFLPGSGIAKAYSSGNYLEAQIEFESPTSFEQQPPTSVRMLPCNAKIEIYDLDFEGSGLTLAMDAIEKPFRNLLEGVIEGVICDELDALADPLSNKVLPMMDEFLEPHLVALPASPLDPLFAESTLSSSSSLENPLINLQELLGQQGDSQSSVGMMMSNLLSQAKDMLGGSPPTNVNDFLRNQLLDQDGCFAIDMTMGDNDVAFSDFFDPSLLESHNDFADMSFTLNGMRLCGLDTISTIDPLEMIGKYTMRNSMQWSSNDNSMITLDLDMGVELKPSTLPDAILKSGPDSTAVDIQENVRVTLGIQDLKIAASTLIAIRQNTLMNMQLGSLLQSSDILPCLLSTLEQVELTGLDMTVGAILDPVVTGFSDQGVQRVVSKFLQGTFFMYRPTVLKAIPNIFQGSLRDLIQEQIITTMSTNEVTACPKFSSELAASEPPTFLDFRDLLLSPSKAVEYGASGSRPYGDMMQTVVNLVKEKLVDVDPETGLSTLNAAVIRKFTESQSSVPGRLSFPGSLFDQSGRISMGGLDASFSFKAYDAYLDNVDSIGAPLSIVDPIKGSRSQLNNTASIGVGTKPLTAGLRFFISIAGKDEVISNDLEISLDMDTATVILTTLLKISESAFFSYPLADLTNTDCLLMMIPPPQLDSRGVRVEGEESSAGLADLVVSVAKMNLNVKCLNCSGPGMNEWENILTASEASDAATETVNNIFDFATKLLGGTFMQVQIDRRLNDARLKCPSSPDYNPLFASTSYEAFEAPEHEDDSIEFLIMLGIAVGCIVVSLLAITLVVKLIVRRRHRKWLATVTGSKAILLWDRQRKEQEKEVEMNSVSKSMFTSPAIPLWLRLLMPVIILCNIGFFLSGHLSLAATVNIEAQLGGQSILFDNFFEFSMMKSTVEIWNAGGKELAILILIFSGIWPYTKQLITLSLWFMPPSMVSISKRESILLWLDALAKWSMVDIMTLIVTIAGFRVTIQSPDVGFLPENMYSIDLLVAPLWGVYANMIAQIISQISSHFIIHYHRRVQECAAQEYDRIHSVQSTRTATLDEESDGNSSISTASGQETVLSSTWLSDSPQERLYEHTFSRPHRGESDKLTPRRGVNGMVVATGIALSILVLLGCILPSFSLEILGMVGLMVESGQGFQEAKTSHSVFSIVSMLMQQAAFTGRTSDFIGLGSLCALLIITVLLVPLALALVLLYQWMHPLSTRRRYRCEVLVEALQAWQYAEVYIVSVIVASWQLGPVSEFMVNAYCGSLKETFSQLVFYGVMKEEDAQCFKITSGIDDGAFVLAAGAVLLALLSTFVTRAVGQYFRDYKNEGRRHQDSVKLQALIGAPEEDIAQAKKGLSPVPVLFTDTFRWFLIRQDVAASSIRPPSSSDESQSSSSDNMSTNSGNREEADGPYSSYQYSPDDDEH